MIPIKNLYGFLTGFTHTHQIWFEHFGELYSVVKVLSVSVGVQSVAVRGFPLLPQSTAFAYSELKTSEACLPARQGSGELWKQFKTAHSGGCRD